MKKVLISIIIYFLFIPLYSFGQEGPTQVFEDKCVISKVNRVEKIWEIPPDRRGFMGDRIIVRKFNYLRELDIEKRGEEYVITWRYKGKELADNLVLRFEYITEQNILTEPFIEEYIQEKVKRGSYKWVFSNIGNNYLQKGKITSWKVSLLYNSQIVAEKKSANWHSLKGT